MKMIGPFTVARELRRMALSQGAVVRADGELVHLFATRRAAERWLEQVRCDRQVPASATYGWEAVSWPN